MGESPWPLSSFGVDHGDEVSKSAQAVADVLNHGRTGARLKWLGQDAGRAAKKVAPVAAAGAGGYALGSKKNKVKKSLHDDIEKWFGAPAAKVGANTAAGARRATAAGFKAGAHGKGSNAKSFGLRATGKRTMLNAKTKVGNLSGNQKLGAVAAGAGGLGATGGNAYSQKKINKALANPMPKMARLTKPMGAKAAGAKPAAGNPMLRQVNRLSQGASAPMGGRPMGGLQQRLGQQRQNVRAGAAGRSSTNSLRQRLGGNR